jgi:hypothetical protein
MVNFVLVHGSTHSALAWDLVRAELERQQQTVTTPELPTDEPEASATRFADAIAASILEEDYPIVVAFRRRLVSTARRGLSPGPSYRVLAATVPRIGSSFHQK